MERRLLLVFALTFLVIMLFQPILKKYGPQAPESKPQKQNQPARNPQDQGAQNQGLQNEAAPPANSAVVENGAATPPAAGVKQASAEAQTIIENDLYRITFTNRGAQVTSWILKKFTDDKGGPLELVNSLAAAKYGYPLSLWSYDDSLRNKLNSALFVASSSGTLAAPAEITFEYSGQGISVRKTFGFDHTYVLRVETSVVSQGSPVAALPAWPAGFGDETSPSSYASSRIEYQNNSTIERLAIKKISGGNTVRGPFAWAGPVDQYFGAVFLPEDSQNATLITLRNPVEVPRDLKNPNNKETIKEDVLGAAVGDSRGETRERMFVGPKSLPVLESVKVPTIAGTDQDLRGLVNFGFFGIIARPLFLWLKWMTQYVGNWGWAIILQTLIITLALMPLRISQMKSMLKMQRVAPQIKAIQEKYKKYGMRDPRKQAMNEEISALYKKEGVNPAGGCLPLVVQLPFLWAYYAMLGVAIDLRHAHWLWIPDLSSADPWHILPIGIIITMLLTQRMTPQQGMDPAQQKMMNLLMPVMLGVISWNLAAGLTLYWSVSQLIGIAQQAIINRTALGREMQEMMAKRARKKEK